MVSLYNICETKENVNLKNLCSIGIGGIGECVCFPKNEVELKRLIKYLKVKNIKYYIVGNGTNVVFEDDGVSEVIICLKKMCGYKINGNKIMAYAGLNLFAFNYLCKENGLGGMEWSYGIPASVGGAICMNAGAYGGEIKDNIKNVWVLRNGEIKKLNNAEMKFGYRKSCILNSEDIIIKAEFALKHSTSNEVQEKQEQIFSLRKRSQPYGTKNAGSIFKKFNDESAGKIIDKLGLKNVKIGDIEISGIHANFFINLGNGKSTDLHTLINYVKDLVFSKNGIKLEEEVIFIGKRRN